MERPEHGRLGRALRLPAVDQLDEHRHAEHVGEQDELLPGLVRPLPGGGQEIDGGPPLVQGGLGLADEGVQVSHEAGQQLPQPRIRRAGEAGDDLVRRRVLGEVDGDHPLRDGTPPAVGRPPPSAYAAVIPRAASCFAPSGGTHRWPAPPPRPSPRPADPAAATPIRAHAGTRGGKAHRVRRDQRLGLPGRRLAAPRAAGSAPPAWPHDQVASWSRRHASLTPPGRQPTRGLTMRGSHPLARRETACASRSPLHCQGE